MSSLPRGACASCDHFQPRPGDSPDGHCGRFKVATWGAYAGGCADGWRPADPALVALARRRHAVAKQLEADPSLRYAYDVQDATPSGPAVADVSVMLGVRTADGAIVAGELRVPAARWPGVGAFAEHWRQAGEALPPPAST